MSSILHNTEPFCHHNAQVAPWETQPLPSPTLANHQRPLFYNSVISLLVFLPHFQTHVIAAGCWLSRIRLWSASQVWPPLPLSHPVNLHPINGTLIFGNFFLLYSIIWQPYLHLSGWIVYLCIKAGALNTVSTPFSLSFLITTMGSVIPTSLNHGD